MNMVRMELGMYVLEIEELLMGRNKVNTCSTID
jgi:hypothetical protein